MNTYSFEATTKQIADMLAYFPSSNIESDIGYIDYQIKYDNCVISIYSSKKVVIQGKNSEKYYQMFNKQIPNSFIEQAGSDEVGTGDFFGPICVCGSYIDNKTYELLKTYKFDDSKKLTDEYICEIVPKIIDIVPHNLLIVDNKKYNEVVKENNMNAIKAKLHNQVYVNMIKNGVKLPPLVVIDQFCSPSNYYNYLKDQKHIIKDITFETKAESKYLSVAISSMISRYAFLQEMQKLNQKYQMNFPKGAGSNVDEFAKEFIKKYPEELANVAKMNFKNLLKIKGIV